MSSTGPVEPIPDEVERVATTIVDAALQVHKALGPGLLESVYEACLCHELAQRNVRFQRQVELPIQYGGRFLDSGLRLDLVVERKVIVELKAVEMLQPIHTAQLLTYLRLSGLRLGLLANFNVIRMRDGIKRVAL